ncbi:Hypothetical predicted protein [Scomber scombrus]|uniref:Secreted protein n=1 Tax=Scomber scombrus TaxID=13677 RepID=A0AAV1PXS6_SCOSC
MERLPLICTTLIWLVFHRDAIDKTSKGRLACSVCVPHGALRASDCQSTRPSGAHSALHGCVPSLRCPSLDCCATATSLACYFTSTALWTLLFHCIPNSSRLWQMYDV